MLDLKLINVTSKTLLYVDKSSGINIWSYIWYARRLALKGLTHELFIYVLY